MADEGSYPVAGQAVTQHGAVVLAGGDHVVLRRGARGGEEGGEGDVGDGARVAMAG